MPIAEFGLDYFINFANLGCFFAINYNIYVKNYPCNNSTDKPWNFC